MPREQPHPLTPSPQAGRGNSRAQAAVADSPSPKSGRGPGGGVQWRTSPDLWKKLKPLAREKRKNPTEAEERLWQHVRKKQLRGYKFRRQHTIDRFIVDFYCRDANLVVEVDGPIHQYTPEEDNLREQFLEEQGLTVLRFDNEQVLKDIDSVLETIAASLPRPRSATTPSPSTGRGTGGGVYYADLWGRRDSKYQALLAGDVSATEWQELTPTEPHYFLVPKDFDLLGEYQRGWSVEDIFPVHSSGIKTHRDDFVIDFDEDELRKRIASFRDTKLDDRDLAQRYDLEDTSSWNLTEARKALQERDNWDASFTQCLYRPFDIRLIYYSVDMVDRPRFDVMKHMLAENLGMLTIRQVVGARYTHFLATKSITDNRTFFSNRGTPVLFPLYLYNNTRQERKKRAGSAFTLSLFEGQEAYQTRQPNLSQAFLAAVKDKLGLGFVPEGCGDLGLSLPDVGEGAGGRGQSTFGPEDIFHYAYAVFHAPTYRERYAEFLKIDFPRLPLTADLALFRALAKKGRELVSLHLMEADVLQQTGVRYPVSGSNHVASRRPCYLAPDGPDPESGEPLRAGRVYINKEQYFEGIEPDVWDFQIGGYQVLDKWLKDRKRANRALDFDDVRHYGRIVVALRHTIRLMAEIDDLIPGWPLD